MASPIEFYKACIKQLLGEYEQLKTEWSAAELVFDDERMRYLVMRTGWFRGKRIHQCMVHIDICADKIVIQANHTERLLDEELMEMGVPRDKLCLGFIPPQMQTETEPTAMIKAFVLA